MFVAYVCVSVCICDSKSFHIIIYFTGSKAVASHYKNDSISVL